MILTHLVLFGFLGGASAGVAPPVVTPVAIDHGGGPMGGPIGKWDDAIVDLSDDADESEVAEIAALVVRYFA